MDGGWGPRSHCPSVIEKVSLSQCVTRLRRVWIVTAPPPRHSVISPLSWFEFIPFIPGRRIFGICLFVDSLFDNYYFVIVRLPALNLSGALMLNIDI